MKENRNIDMNDLDRKLSSPDQLWVSKAVSAMPEDDLSMAWRSQLNSKIVALAVVELIVTLFSAGYGEALFGP